MQASGAMIPFKKLLTYMVSVIFFLPWIVMATPQIGGTRKRANAIFAATIGRAKKCQRRMPAQWPSARRCSRTSTAEDPITPPLLRSLVLKALREHAKVMFVRCMAQFVRGAITAATALAAMRVIVPAVDIKPLYTLAGVAGGQAISSYKQHARFGGGGTAMSHTHLLLALLLQACAPVAAMDDGPGLDNSYMAPLVSAAAGAAAAVIAAATDSSGSDDEDATATALHTEQLHAEQRRKQHPLPVTAADYQYMETQIQQALAEDLQMMDDDDSSDEDASDADSSDAEDSDEEDSNSHAFARITAFCISGCNRAAHKLIGGAVLARQTSLVNGDPAVLIQKSDKHKVEVQERRNKSRDNQQTFLSLEKLLVKEVSWTRSQKHNTVLLRTSGDRVLYCTAEPSEHVDESLFNSARFADPSAYGIRLGRTRVRGGGIVTGVRGMHCKVGYGLSLEPTFRRATSAAAQEMTASAPSPAAAPAPAAPAPAAPAAPAAAPAAPAPPAPAPAAPAPAPPAAAAAAFLPLSKDQAKKVDLTGDTSRLRVWVGRDVDGRRCWVRGAITSFEAVDSHRLIKLTLQRDRLRINNTNQDAVGVDGPLELSINSYREETSGISGVTVFGNRAPGVDSWFLAQRKRASKKGSKGKQQYVRTPTRTELLSLSDVLKRAEPAQGITPLCEAWGTYLLQRACLVFEGMLVMHVYLTDAKVKRKSGSRVDANEWVRKGKYLRPNQPHLHSNGKRTHGIVRAIANAVTCDRLLPRKQHRYTHLDTSSSYMAFCWPGLSQQTVDTLELETLPRKTAANVTPVNSVIKILSTAAVLGRLPTCASGAVMLTQEELELAETRIHATTVADDRKPFGVLETLVPPSHPSLPRALEALVCSKRGGERAPVCVVNSTPMARMEMWFLSADTNSGEGARSQSAYCNLMSDAQFCLHTIRSTLQNSLDLSGCTESLRQNQAPFQRYTRLQLKKWQARSQAHEHKAPFQRYTRLQLKKWQARSQAHEHKVKQGRMLPENLMYRIHDMLEGFIRSTWKPFDRAIQRGLETQGRRMADFDGLIQLLAHRRPADGFNMAQTEGDCAHLEVDWVTALAHHMLEAEQFTTYDVANLEILVHLYAYYLLPDIANAELGKVAMSGGDDDSEPMKTYVPVPSELNRPMLTVLFLCRAMRAIHFGTPVPDRLVGLSGGANYQVSQTTFREKVLNEIGRCNLGIPYYASYSNRSTAVTEIFAKAMQMPFGEKQDFIASSESHNYTFHAGP
ncbi:hypothetical protein JKP88DRAFT_272496 [Tribonema minus]|uniref:Uncharacterized protein n=1 Tax=Tribonema minus TaxID=303371 RepID=A0A836CHY4_9STRA|nr:hypothetical protein JKP88DRAFT_272496 [Tribonema minus]